METKLRLPKLMKDRKVRYGKESRSHRKGDRQPLLEDNLTAGVPGTTAGDVWVELGQKLAQDVLSGVTHLGNPSVPGQQPSSHFTAMVKQAVKRSLSRRSVDFGPSKFCLEEHLSDILGGVLGELLRQDPGPEVAHILDAVAEALYCYVGVQQKATLLLVQNVAEAFLSDSTAARTSKAAAPPVIADWLQSAERKYLDSTTKDIPDLLVRILKHEEAFRCSNDPKDEEDFIMLQLDVEQILVQLLIGRISQAYLQGVSQCLMERIQGICYDELLLFIERYVKNETRHLKKRQKPDESSRRHQFRTFNTCMAFKKLVEKMARERSDSPVQVIALLKDTQIRAQELLLKEPLRLAQMSFKKYFEGRDINMENVMWQVGPHFENLPLKGKEAHKELVEIAQWQISWLYFDRLLLSNRKALERRWGDIGARVRADAVCLHSTFSRLSVGTQPGHRGRDGHNPEQNPEEPRGTQRNQMLLKVAEVLQLTDVEALAETGHEMLNKMSQKRLRALLHWKGGLSKEQVRQVMETSREESRAPSRPLRLACCC